MKVLTHGSLFAGIGGFDLGFERAGIKTVWQVEIDPFCRKVLEKHFPNVQRITDVRDAGRSSLEPVDVIAGGFPCQDVSCANPSGRGLDGARSGLWSEMLRVVCEFRPRFVVVENVAALLGDGMGRVIGDLAAIGYDAEWECLPAYAFGACHYRDRVFVIANLPNPDDAQDQGQGLRNRILSQQPRRVPWWPSYAGIRRGNDGIPAWMDRLHAIGNAVVPQIAEWIGKRIIEAVSGESGRNPVESRSEKMPQGLKKGQDFKAKYPPTPEMIRRGLKTEMFHIRSSMSHKERASHMAQIPPELANCVADYAERLLLTTVDVAGSSGQTDHVDRNSGDGS